MTSNQKVTIQIVTDIGPFLKKKAYSKLKKGVPLILISYIFVYFIGLDYSPFHLDLENLTAPSYFIAGVVFTYGLLQFMVPYKYLMSGLHGERKVVNNISTKLGKAHFLFNDIRFKDGIVGNIDHIIVNERGIFVIETKNIEGKVIINENYWLGFKSSPCIQAINNAKRVRLLLEKEKVLDREVPRVNAIVILTNPKVKPNYQKLPTDCKIIEMKDEADTSLKDYILSFDPTFFTFDEVLKIVNCIDFAKLDT